MNYLCTIVSEKYKKYADKMIKTAFDTGFEGIVEIVDSWSIRPPVPSRYRDERWSQFELDGKFPNDSRVIYMDADCVFHDGFPWKDIFKYEFACSVMTDWVDEQMVINSLANKVIKQKYIATPFVFRVTPGTNKFFALCRALVHASIYYGRGTMVPFNVACYFMNKPNEIIPRNKVCYAQDILNDNEPENAWITHFAGGAGKEIWEERYG